MHVRQSISLVVVITERRPIHGFMKVYEPSGGSKLSGLNPTNGEEEEEGEDGTVDDYDLRHVAKESHIPNHNVSGKGARRRLNRD